MKKIITFILIFLLLYTVISSPSLAATDTNTGQKQELEKQIQEYQKKLDEVRTQKNTLSSQIQLMDAQMYLNTLKVKETEQKIITTEKELDILSSRIEKLDSSLNSLSKVLLETVADAYKQQKVTFFDVIFSSNNVGNLLNQMQYARVNQDNSQKLLIQAQEAKLNFEEQKTLRENKRKELDSLKVQLEEQKNNLIAQKSAKQKLLEVTKNDEKNYQTLLDKAKAEYTAIQTIVTIGGNESKMREVKRGENIANIIPGASCNSGGSHTHFIVKVNGAIANPFNYLKPVAFTNCSGSSCGSSDGDAFNPSGSWDWPLNPGIELEQGFGSTWATRNTWVGRIYNSHNGIDINGASNDVLAVSDGTLYKGGFSGTNGCTLPYVKLVHADTSTITYYLHVYPR